MLTSGGGTPARHVLTPCTTLPRNSHSMDASSASSVCGAGSCTSSWKLSCLKGGSYVQVYSGTGGNVTWTSGNGVGFTIDTRNLTAPMPCNVTLNWTNSELAQGACVCGFGAGRAHETAQRGPRACRCRH